MLVDDFQYQLGEDSQRQAGIPEGKIEQHTFTNSKVFPDAKRHPPIYAPAQYDGSKPACLMVFQDGHANEAVDGKFRVPIVFDNLIHKKEMPITIAVFIDPGHKKPKLPPQRGWRPKPENRSFEYDALSDAYSRLLMEELLPEVEQNTKSAKTQLAEPSVESAPVVYVRLRWPGSDRTRLARS